MKGGILLYTLVISLIFGLLLQFYLQNQVAQRRHLLLQKDRLTAELMISMIKKHQEKTAETLVFNQGIIYRTSQSKNALAEFDVKLKDGVEFHLKSDF